MIRPSSDLKKVCRRKPRASGDDPPEEVPDAAEEEVNPARAGMILVGVGVTPR